MRKDANRYYPPGYCGTYSLIESAYFHLFPKPLQDSELFEASLRYMDFEDDISRNNRRLDAYGLPKDIARELRREICTLATEVSLCRFVERAMTDRLFNPVLSLFPPFPEFEFVNFPLAGNEYVIAATATKPDWLEHQTPPYHIVEIGRSRLRRVTGLIRDKLIASDLRCFAASSHAGIVELNSASIWLDDATAIPALETGKVSASLLQGHGSPGTDVGLIFDQKSLGRVLPEYGRDRARSDGDDRDVSAGKQGRVERWMCNRFGDDRPNITIKNLIELYVAEEGESVSDSYMTRARSTVYPDSAE